MTKSEPVDTDAKAHRIAQKIANERPLRREKDAPEGQVSGGFNQQSRHGSREEGLDRADPHPAEQGDPYNTARSAGVARRTDIGPNPAMHDGVAPPQPENASTKGRQEHSATRRP